MIIKIFLEFLYCTATNSLLLSLSFSPTQTHIHPAHFESCLSATGCLSLSALIVSNSVFNREPNQDEFVSLALCSSLAGASTSNHLSLQRSDPQLFFVRCTSSSLFSALIACERCPLWFRLHAKVLSGRECRKVSCVSVCSEDEGAAYSPAEDKPVSPRDVTHLSPAQRISVLSVNIIAKGWGSQDWRGIGGKHGDWYCELCTYGRALTCVCVQYLNLFRSGFVC